MASQHIRPNLDMPQANDIKIGDIAPAMRAAAKIEFTGKKYPKVKHRFTLNGEAFMAIAGLWREARERRALSSRAAGF
ncbi:hypothetical protein ACU8NH_30615 (plasmid) [Rhizobium leguminosarum]|uniref:Uncharacterized protein n=2 Tax=Rhizobium TaxID=379 RepID=A0ACD5EGR0_9HYPH